TNLNGYTTYQSWDISAGNGDINITIDLAGTTNTVPRLSGLAFDSLPITNPTVLIQPVGGTFFVGNPISLSVNAGGTAIGYQWLKNSNSISGATANTFTITNAATTDSGNYQVLITNSVGSVTSMVAAVSVLAPPVTVIYQDSMGGTAAALNGRIPDTVGTSPWTAASVWNTDGTEATAPSTGLAFLPFTPQAGRIYTLSADIEDFDTSGNNWTALGFANGNLVNGQWHTVGNNPVGWFLARGDNTTVNQAFIGPNTQQGQAFNYAPTNMTHYQVIFDATPASPANWTFTYLANGTIYVPATIFGGSGPTITTVGFGAQGPATGYVKNFKLSQQVPFSAPFVTLQPLGGTNFVGETKTLSVQAGGSDPLTYQWQKNSNNIPNATNLVLTLNNLQTSDSGSYRLLITNPLGSTNSAGTSIIVLTPVVSTIYHDTFSHVTNDLNGSLPDTAGQSTWIANSTWSSDGTEAVANSSASANAYLPFVPQAGNVYTLSANIDCTGGNWIALGFADADNTGFDWQSSPNNPVGWCLARPDSFLLDNQVFVGPGTAGGTDTGFAPTGGTHNYAVILDTRPASPSAWTFTFQMDSNTLVGPKAFGGSGPSISDVGLGSYSISQGIVNNFILTEASVSPTAPVVLTQPIGGTFLIGSQASLSAYAGGSGPLTYQWQKNSNNIAGANSPQLTLANLALTDSGYYRLVVSNAISSVSSSNALITVASSIPIVIATFDTNANPSGGVYPSIPVNIGTNNLILNNLASVNPAASGNNFTGVYMRNGTTGTNTESSVNNPANIMNAGTYDFIFDTSLNTSGYDITAVVTYSGWVDRAGQDHTVYYRQVGSTNFV
ncbi:MAG TPA: immunoglobulin domain-containing protein, partial [Candidatus Acidoferrum sp.]|nr:immunoglobulin domain-containing protein [Candidatus Acidoferrum sp.]